MSISIINVLNSIIVTEYTAYNMTLGQDFITLHGLLANEDNTWKEVMVQILIEGDSYNIKEIDMKTAEVRWEQTLDSAPAVGDLIHSYSNTLN